VSLRDESLDLRFVVSPKDFSPLTLRTPVRVRGTLGKPAVSLELGKLVGKAGAAGLLSLLNPLAAISVHRPGGKKDAEQADSDCAALAAHERRHSIAGAQPEVGARAAGAAGCLCRRLGLDRRGPGPAVAKRDQAPGLARG
jgi:hypothetical protein